MRDNQINFLLRAVGSTKSRLRKVLYRSMGMRIGARCWLRAVSVPRNPWDIELADNVALDDGVVLLTSGPRQAKPRLRIGPRVYVNRFTFFDVSERVVIGPDCMIGPFVYITDHDHGTDAGQTLAEQPLVGGPVTVGSNVWIGAGVTILKGVDIGDNAVIGAGAVVTRDVAAGARVVGIPAVARARNGGPV